jgi:hypothetical protein
MSPKSLSKFCQFRAMRSLVRWRTSRRLPTASSRDDRGCSPDCRSKLIGLAVVVVYDRCVRGGVLKSSSAQGPAVAS